MIAQLLSPFGFCLMLSTFLIGGIGALLFRKHAQVAHTWSHAWAIAGSLLALTLGALTLFKGTFFSFKLAPVFISFIPFSFSIDGLSAFFITVIAIVALAATLYGTSYAKKFFGIYDVGLLGFFYNFFLLGMFLVVSVSNTLFFLIVWEIMSLASFFLVIYDRKDPENLKAGYLYLIMTQAGTMCLAIAMLFLYRYTGSFEYSEIKNAISLVPAGAMNIVFILSLIGLGTKAGVVPLHIWLPSAHPAAPSHVSALMSGVMIKTGIYMMFRLYFEILHAPVWWGMVILVLGAISALLGVLYALTEHDIKRLLAFHSIENIGIILIGMGGALFFAAAGSSTLAIIGFIGALFHTLNHAIFKSLLFLSAGSVVSETHTRNIEEYGGLIKTMPVTALMFLVGSMAITGLPPLNGFFSEWMTFQSLFVGLAVLTPLYKMAFLFAAGLLVFTSALALACFVKAFGATFLARPRGHVTAHAKDDGSLLLSGMGILAGLCLFVGIFSGSVSSIAEGVATPLLPVADQLRLTSEFSAQSMSVLGGFGHITPPMILVVLAAAIALIAVLVRYAVYPKQRVTVGATWDCGVDLGPRMEITASGFSRSITTVFGKLLKPTKQVEVEYQDADMRYLPKQRQVHLGFTDVYRDFFYHPLHTLMLKISAVGRKIQTGNVNTYVFYMFATLLVLLLIVGLG